MIICLLLSLLQTPATDARPHAQPIAPHVLPHQYGDELAYIPSHSAWLKAAPEASEVWVATTVMETDYTTVPCTTTAVPISVAPNSSPPTTIPESSATQSSAPESYVPPSYAPSSYVVPSYPPPSYAAPSYVPSSYIVPTYPPSSYIAPSYAPPSSAVQPSSPVWTTVVSSAEVTIIETSIVEVTSTTSVVVVVPPPTTESPSIISAPPTSSPSSEFSVPTQVLTTSQEVSIAVPSTTSIVVPPPTSIIIESSSISEITTLNPVHEISASPVLTSLTTSQVQSPPPPSTVTAPGTTGSLITSLEMSGNPTIQPFPTAHFSSHERISAITTGSHVIQSHASMRPTAAQGKNIFSPIASNAPPAQIPSRGDYPVPLTGIVGKGPFQTNKFYGNFYLGTRLQPTWTHPYSVSWAGGSGVTGSWGIAVQQVTSQQRFYGANNSYGYPSYFANPLGLQSLVLSAVQLGNGTNLTMSNLQAFSVNINLAPAQGAANILTFPLVQGMGFVTAQYNSATPMIQSSIFFSNLTYSGNTFGAGTAKYIATLLDDTTWVLYVTPTSGKVPTLTLQGNSRIIGDIPFVGTIQVGKIPTGSKNTVFDKSAGVYPIGSTISGTTKKAAGSYTFTWQKAGLTSRKLLMWALPHHVQTFDATTAKFLTKAQLQTTTKGIATAIISDSWTMAFDDIPYDMAFNPWSPTLRSVNKLSSSAITAMTTAGGSELAQNFTLQTDTSSMYFSGKGLAKFAFIVVALNDLANDTGLASAGLAKLKDAFATFVNNTQQTPLAYDTVWGGAVTQDGYTNPGADFGNTYYNDHHFHYGYFVYTAAVIGYLDPSWLTQGTNKDWTQMLVRDYANSATNDPYFPFSRMFDWFHGHSWAAGLFESGDGKNEESSSEDTFSAYALKMWGRTISDADMEARGNLMLAVQARSLQDYFLMEDDNTIQPQPFVPNKADGILFENKVDHTTYFGTNIEYIEGIHMLPLNPCSTLIRTPEFVNEEWDLYFSNGRVDTIAGGWRGILYANYAIINPTAAYQFFSSPSFNPIYLDGGASQTWYLAWSAGLGGAPS